jgi:hypothetical protein
METVRTPRNSNEFFCETCDYRCFKKQHLEQHYNTIKHKILNGNQEETKNNETTIRCGCGKTYKNRSGMWKHTKICNVKSQEDDTHILSTLVKELIINTKELAKQNQESQQQNKELINQNQELQKHVLEITKTTKTVINNNNTTTNNNQKFNINVFLNETCKDAINFSDFIKNIQITYEDLENNAQLGFVNGISKIFLDNLKQLDINERPIHCTDVKRETMYIKDENTWTKQPDDEKLQKAIQTVSYRSMGKLAEWKQENPDYKDCNSEFSQKCLDIQRQTLAGSDRPVYYPKVIHALARETVLDK